MTDLVPSVGTVQRSLSQQNALECPSIFSLCDVAIDESEITGADVSFPSVFISVGG